MKPSIPTEMKKGFAKRFNEALDQSRFPAKGRASRLGEKYAVSTSAAAAWLKGTIPTVDQLLQICEDFSVDPTYLLTGKDKAVYEIDGFRHASAVRLVNHHLRKLKKAGDVDDTKLAALYQLVYQRLAAGEPMRESEIQAQIQLAL